MDLEIEIRVRDAIKYCIENFDSKTATNRIVEFWKDELKLQEQAINYSHCSCTPDETTGTTTVKCCNICGKPAESFWRYGYLSEQLSKRPNTSSTWECFTKSEKQQKGNV